MIDVIIPAYNCTDTLGRTLASLAAQTDPDFRVIVVDDCSTELLDAVVEEYSGKLDIQMVRNAQNVGCGMSRQAGMDAATASHCIFLDSDDMLMPYAIQTYNACIAADPGIEFLHTHFYEETIVDGDPAVILHTDGYTWCHGKLYNLAALRRYGIRETPEVRWADDSYMNSICGELLIMQIIRLPMMLWTNNRKSVMRRNNPTRDAEAMRDFLNAMCLSCAFVKQYKDEIRHLPHTLALVEKVLPKLGKEEHALYECLKQYGGEG